MTVSLLPAVLEALCHTMLPLSLVPVSLLPAVLEALSQDALGMLCRVSRSFRNLVGKHWSAPPAAACSPGQPRLDVPMPRALIAGQRWEST